LRPYNEHDVDPMMALPPDMILTGLTADSRKVAPGMLFAALPGGRADGRAFIADAIAKGAVAILAPLGTDVAVPAHVRLITDSNPRRRFALMAAAFHEQQPAVIAAVTGTNGKTSTADFTRQIWGRLGHRAASIGTLGIVAPDWDNAGGLTTPDPETLHATLAQLARTGISHACMEASSHGLSQYRLDGVRLQAAAFTNLTRDHLDYHADMAEYGAAKLRLFSEVLPDSATAIVNADSDMAEQVVSIAAGRGQKVLTFGRMGTAITLVDALPQPYGQLLKLNVMGAAAEVRLPLAGTFQAANALAALGLALACGAETTAAIAALDHLTGVPGRLQKVAQRPSDAAIYVDYAHTPDALETVLKALRPHAAGRLLVVFGCGGDRDAGKRPQMGAIAQRLADRVFVTDDNPRSENPAAIRRAILAACPDAIEIGDRARAIREAVADLRRGDVLVLAGKGHERGQIVAGTVLAFDDSDEARRAVAELDGVAP
jgi:UDP-N-acetylmuramoyl-L-alanyl-D-glutamate--2,6-diaminopimelate ligase